MSWVGHTHTLLTLIIHMASYKYIHAHELYESLKNNKDS